MSFYVLCPALVVIVTATIGFMMAMIADVNVYSSATKRKKKVTVGEKSCQVRVCCQSDITRGLTVIIFIIISQVLKLRTTM